MPDHHHLETTTTNGHTEPNPLHGNDVPAGHRWSGRPPESTVGPDRELADRIRRLRATARRTGERIPGRPALVAATGATQHQVRKALDEISREESVGRHATPASTDPAASPASLGDYSPTSAGNGPPAESARIGSSPTQANASDTVGQHRRPPAWPLVIIGLAAAISVWSGWVGLAKLAGFGMIQPLPGVWDQLRINTAVVLPISVEAYAAYALRCWLTNRTITPRARTFARHSAIVSLTIGATAQIAYHLMTAAGLDHAPWPVTVGVATTPVIVLGLASALANLISDQRGGWA